jgi:hypothetical protein
MHNWRAAATGKLDEAAAGCLTNPSIIFSDDADALVRLLKKREATLFNALDAKARSEVFDSHRPMRWWYGRKTQVGQTRVDVLHPSRGAGAERYSKSAARDPDRIDGHHRRGPRELFSAWDLGQNRSDGPRSQQSAGRQRALRSFHRRLRRSTGKTHAKGRQSLSRHGIAPISPRSPRSAPISRATSSGAL